MQEKEHNNKFFQCNKNDFLEIVKTSNNNYEPLFCFLVSDNRTNQYKTVYKQCLGYDNGFYEMPEYNYAFCFNKNKVSNRDYNFYEQIKTKDFNEMCKDDNNIKNAINILDQTSIQQYQLITEKNDENKEIKQMRCWFNIPGLSKDTQLISFQADDDFVISEQGKIVFCHIREGAEEKRYFNGIPVKLHLDSDHLVCNQNGSPTKLEFYEKVPKFFNLKLDTIITIKDENYFVFNTKPKIFFSDDFSLFEQEGIQISIKCETTKTGKRKFFYKCLKQHYKNNQPCKDNQFEKDYDWVEFDIQQALSGIGKVITITLNDRKNIKIQKQLEKYDKIKQEQQELVKTREERCFKDAKKITDKDRRSKNYKKKIRDFEVKKYLHKMYPSSFKEPKKKKLTNTKKLNNEKLKNKLL